MASITIFDLNPTGSELFFDSESYLKELSEAELAIQGGATPFLAGLVAGAAFSFVLEPDQSYLAYSDSKTVSLHIQSKQTSLKGEKNGQ